MTFVTRFAPSPTGPLHLGHAYSALLAHDMARANDGAFLLRIEDIDRGRSRPEWEDQIFDDLTWLGITWDAPVMRQSERSDDYSNALKMLWRQKLAFACNCSRRDIADAVSAPQEGAPTTGPDGILYPGTCRARIAEDPLKPFPTEHALRLAMSRAVGELAPNELLSFHEALYRGPREVCIDPKTLETCVGDIVLARRDMGTSYHLSVVIDDAEQGVTDVIRGEDLFDATTIHVVLQRLLGLPTPTYHHHRLVRDEAGKRLAKRDDARAIRKYREDGATPDDIRRMVGLSTHGA